MYESRDRNGLWHVFVVQFRELKLRFAQLTNISFANETAIPSDTPDVHI